MEIKSTFNNVYVILANLDNWYNSSSEFSNILECALSEGTIYPIAEFSTLFNNGELQELINGENTIMGMCYKVSEDYFEEIK